MAQPGVTVIEFRTLKKTRRYGAKVKTGCITCKLRHVRCDEGKPACLKCTNSGRKCDGYAPVRAAQSKSSSPEGSIISQCSNPMVSEAGENVRYLEFYHHCAGTTLSSKFDEGFWSRTTLQLAQSEPSIRHALIALGYLNKIEPGSLKHARSGFSANSQHETLFRHYNKALGSLVMRMTEPSYTPEIGLVACLLFVCIEFIRGDYHTAFTHLQSGLKLLFQSPQNTMIQHNLVSMFNRTMTAALLYGMTVPDIFDVSITGRQNYPQQTFGIYEIPTPRPQSYPQQAFPSLDEAQAAATQLRNASIMFIREWGQKLFIKIPVTPDALAIKAQLLQCHESWSRSFHLLERRSRFSEEDRVKASQIKVLHYPMNIAVAVATDMDQTQYDAYTPRFKAINHHVRVLLDSMGLAGNNTLSNPHSTKPPKAAANFTFEVSVIPSLHYVATRCRCPVTRREAVAMLELNPPREALWDAEQHAAVAKRSIEIEEQVVDPETGWPLESSRLWAAAIDGDMDENGGFWVAFSYADWAKTCSISYTRRRRLDAQWDEWFVL
ncbi:hypothetical protein K458DRAFT_321604 [Lentithecium fluviatile CBS 122367]|uniref:Zn(2)-C6 fungal-type domain-containing protein n=1 Tax=Lentithecium fluviatile CBS 122367 TaxID=1168545 RepID=A0A6G1IEY9_9PLEO|nr:hypothetical protein K458DRAFT_321604 [Lentithecium fluviatile CBS 122367]